VTLFIAFDCEYTSPLSAARKTPIIYLRALALHVIQTNSIREHILQLETLAFDKSEKCNHLEPFKLIVGNVLENYDFEE
jgi:hypothetical protein